MQIQTIQSLLSATISRMTIPNRKESHYLPWFKTRTLGHCSKESVGASLPPWRQWPLHGTLLAPSKLPLRLESLNSSWKLAFITFMNEFGLPSDSSIEFILYISSYHQTEWWSPIHDMIWHEIPFHSFLTLSTLVIFDFYLLYHWLRVDTTRID